MIDLWQRIDKVALTGRVDPSGARGLRPTGGHAHHRADAGQFRRQRCPTFCSQLLAIAGMKASGSERLLDGAFKGRETRMIVIGALVGGLSPFCSCQVIPFVAALLAQVRRCLQSWPSGWPRPLMDPAMFRGSRRGASASTSRWPRRWPPWRWVWRGGLTVKMIAASPVFADPPAHRAQGRRLLQGEEDDAELAAFWQERRNAAAPLPKAGGPTSCSSASG